MIWNSNNSQSGLRLQGPPPNGNISQPPKPLPSKKNDDPNPDEYPGETVTERYLRLILWYVKIMTIFTFITLAFMVGAVVMLSQRTSELEDTVTLAHSALQQFNDSKVLVTATMVNEDFNKYHYGTIKNILQGVNDAAVYAEEVIDELRLLNSTEIIRDVLKDAKKTAGFISTILEVASERWSQQYISTSTP